MSTFHYLDTLKIADDNLQAKLPRRTRLPPGPTRSIRDGVAVPETLPASAVVDVGSVISFVDGLNEQEKDDVLYSVQLAQRGASGAYNRISQTESWYGKYLEILENLGWAGEQLAFARYTQAEGELRMDQAALKVIMAVATQNQLTILTESVKALESLADNDGTIKFFDFHCTSQTGGNFQLGAVQKASNNALAMVLGAFHFTSTDARRKFLFFSWGAQSLHFWTAAQRMTLNTAMYAENRAKVQQKLGLKAEEYIAELVLA